MDIDLDEYEKIIAYNALTDATYLSAITDYIKPSYFKDSRIASYFEIVKVFNEKHRSLPTFTEVKSYLNTDPLKRGFLSLSETFKTLDKKFNKEELYTNTERYIKDRATCAALEIMADDIDETRSNPSKVLQAFEDICRITLDIEHGLDFYRDMELILDDVSNKDVCISTGWSWLDDVLDGGWRLLGKALYMFAGEANIGKSIFLGNVAANIAETGKTVLVISLEMSEMLYAKRIASKISKIPMRDFKDNIHELRDSLKEAKKNCPDGNIIIKEFPPSTVTPTKLIAYIKKLTDAGIQIDAIVIDYLSLLTCDKGTNSYERVKFICEQVRAMSYVFKCPIISACQLNRSSYSKDNPGMDGIGESLGIAMTADVILSIFQSEEDREMDIIKLGLPKNRFGPRGMVKSMRIVYDTLTVIQSDEECEYIDDSGSNNADDVMSRLQKFST